MKDWHLGRPLSEVLVGDIVQPPSGDGTAARVTSVGHDTTFSTHIVVNRQGYPPIVGPPTMKVDIFK